MTVLANNLVLQDLISHTFLFKDFIIHNKWLGFCFYKGFIINACGFHKAHCQSTLLLLNFPLQSEFHENCVKENDFKLDSSPIGLSTNPLCYVDFNPYMHICGTSYKHPLRVTFENEARCDVNELEPFNIEGKSLVIIGIKNFTNI